MYQSNSLFSLIKRHLIAIMIVIGHLMGRFNNFKENVGHLFFDLTLYRGQQLKPDFTVSDEEADGYILVRRTDEFGQSYLEGINFRCLNRWPVRDGRRPIGLYAMELHTEILLRGWAVTKVVWGGLHNKTASDNAFNLTRLLPESTIAKYNRRRVRLQAFLDRILPGSRHQFPTLAEHTRADLIHRV